jgi:hypothetical protein
LQNDPITPAADNTDMKFDDINLNDDKAAPKLDLDFGLGDTKSGDKKSGGFSFGSSGGGWGGGWGASSWGFGGTEDKSDTKVDDSWGFGAGKKDKKKKDAGFDFDFGSTGIEDDLGLGTARAEPVDDPW